MQEDELRRAPRVRVCCRVDVTQPHAVWSAVTADLSARGCRIVTSQLPNLGSHLRLTLSSDLFPEQLEALGEVVWVSPDQLGVLFVDVARRSVSPAAWVEQVLLHGSAGDAPRFSPAAHVVPVVVPEAERQGAIPIQSGRRRSG